MYYCQSHAALVTISHCSDYLRHHPDNEAAQDQEYFSSGLGFLENNQIVVIALACKLFFM